MAYPVETSRQLPSLFNRPMRLRTLIKPGLAGMLGCLVALFAASPAQADENGNGTSAFPRLQDDCSCTSGALLPTKTVGGHIKKCPLHTLPPVTFGPPGRRPPQEEDPPPICREDFLPRDEPTFEPESVTIQPEGLWFGPLKASDLDAFDSTGAKVAEVDELEFDGLLWGGHLALDVPIFGYKTRLFVAVLQGEVELEFDFVTSGLGGFRDSSGAFVTSVHYDVLYIYGGVELDLYRHDCPTESWGIALAAYYYTLRLDPQDVDTNKLDFEGGGVAVSGWLRLPISEKFWFDGRVSVHGVFGDLTGIGASADVGFTFFFGG